MPFLGHLNSLPPPLTVSEHSGEVARDAWESALETQISPDATPHEGSHGRERLGRLGSRNAAGAHSVRRSLCPGPHRRSSDMPRSATAPHAGHKLCASTLKLTERCDQLQPLCVTFRRGALHVTVSYRSGLRPSARATCSEVLFCRAGSVEYRDKEPAIRSETVCQIAGG